MDEEEALAGGNWTDEVVRVDGTVHRSRGPNSDFAATLLAELEGLGIPFAPAYLGRDDKGRDVFTYFVGSTTEHPNQRSEDSYVTGGQMLRQLHDATTGHPLAAGGECVIHGDPGPFNTIFRDGMPLASLIGTPPNLVSGWTIWRTWHGHGVYTPTAGFRCTIKHGG